MFNKKDEEQYPTWANMIAHLHVDFDLPDWDAYVTAAKQKPLYGLSSDETVADLARASHFGSTRPNVAR